MIHQPSGGASGQATDIQIQAEEILKIKKKLTNIYAKHTNQDFDLLTAKMERDTFLDPEEAKQLGLIDSVLEQPPSVSKDDWFRKELFEGQEFVKEEKKNKVD